MHKIFGTKENEEYIDREGVYLIPVRNNQVGVVRTPKGYFFLVEEQKMAKVIFCASKESVWKKQGVRAL